MNKTEAIKSIEKLIDSYQSTAVFDCQCDILRSCETCEIKRDRQKTVSLAIIALEALDTTIKRTQDLVKALEELARLGGPNGGYGNSIGNEIAQRALERWNKEKTIKDDGESHS